MSDAEVASMPSVGDTPALKAEYQQIKDAWKARVASAEAAEKAGQTVDQATKQLTPIEKERLAEIDKLMVLRKRGDEEETLKANGITTGTAAWFAEVTSTTFLNHSIICHRLLAERLKLAEQALANETPPAAGWFGGAHSLRKVGESLHSFGLAIDIDGGRNPYLVNPSAANARFVENPARSKAISDVIGRAQLLVEGTTPAEADFHTRPTNADKDARAMASYDKLQTASNSLATYFTLDTAAGGRIWTRKSRRSPPDKAAVRRPPGSSRQGRPSDLGRTRVRQELEPAHHRLPAPGPSTGLRPDQLRRWRAHLAR